MPWDPLEPPKVIWSIEETLQLVKRISTDNELRRAFYPRKGEPRCPSNRRYQLEKQLTIELLPDHDFIKWLNFMTPDKNVPAYLKVAETSLTLPIAGRLRRIEKKTSPVIRMIGHQYRAAADLPAGSEAERLWQRDKDELPWLFMLNALMARNTPVITPPVQSRAPQRALLTPSATPPPPPKRARAASTPSTSSAPTSSSESSSIEEIEVIDTLPPQPKGKGKANTKAKAPISRRRRVIISSSPSSSQPSFSSSSSASSEEDFDGSMKSASSDGIEFVKAVVKTAQPGIKLCIKRHGPPDTSRTPADSVAVASAKQSSSRRSPSLFNIVELDRVNRVTTQQAPSVTPPPPPKRTRLSSTSSSSSATTFSLRSSSSAARDALRPQAKKTKTSTNGVASESSDGINFAKAVVKPVTEKANETPSSTQGSRIANPTNGVTHGPWPASLFEIADLGTSSPGSASPPHMRSRSASPVTSVRASADRTSGSAAQNEYFAAPPSFDESRSEYGSQSMSQSGGVHSDEQSDEGMDNDGDGDKSEGLEDYDEESEVGEEWGVSIPRELRRYVRPGAISALDRLPIFVPRDKKSVAYRAMLVEAFIEAKSGTASSISAYCEKYGHAHGAQIRPPQDTSYTWAKRKHAPQFQDGEGWKILRDSLSRLEGRLRSVVRSQVKAGRKPRLNDACLAKIITKTAEYPHIERTHIERTAAAMARTVVQQQVDNGETI